MGRPDDAVRLSRPHALIYGHVNPYGRFDLNLNSRISFV